MDFLVKLTRFETLPVLVSARCINRGDKVERVFTRNHLAGILNFSAHLLPLLSALVCSSEIQFPDEEVFA